MSEQATTSFLDLSPPSSPLTDSVFHAGVDLVDTARLWQALDRYGEPLHRRIFGSEPNGWLGGEPYEPNGWLGGEDDGPSTGLYGGARESIVRTCGRAHMSSRSHVGDADMTAGAFGIKESVVKAMGGLPHGGRLADIQVRADGIVTLGGVMAEWANTRQVGLVGGYLVLRPGLVLSWVLGVGAGTAAP